MRASTLALILLSTLAASTSATASPRRAQSWFIEAISTDGKRALLRDITDSLGMRYRVIEIDTNKVEREVELPALEALPRETMSDGGGKRREVKLDGAALAPDLQAAGAMLRGFPLGAIDRLAVSPDGRHVAFNAGDWIYVATDGAIGQRLSNDASYYPMFTPDGALLYSRHNGRIDGVVGKYELFATSADGRAPSRRLAGTAAVFPPFAVGKQALRFIATYEPQIHTCVVEVALAKPHAVKKLGCLPDGEKVVSCVLSRGGAWAACSTVKELAELDPNTTTIVNGKRVPTKKKRFRVRTLEAATGKVAYDQLGPSGGLSAISDEGLLVVLSTTGIDVIDPKGQRRALKTQVRPSLFTHFRNARELVAEVGGSIQLIDTTK